MKNIIWTEDYLAEQLKRKKIFYYEQYKDYKIGDFFIECLDKEHIFNYSHMDGKLFKRCLCCDNTISIVLEDNSHITRCYTEHISEKAFDKFCESFKSREVRIKAMFFIHENVGEIWDDINPGEVQTNCAKIINADINEICKENPDISREDFEELLYDPNFFNVKTCSRLWHEKLHNKFVSSDFFSEDTSEQEKVEDEVTVEQPIKEEQQEKPVFEHAETSILPEKREKFRYIISNDPQEVETIEETIAIYVKNNQPAELCKYLFNNESLLFLKMPAKSVPIFDEIVRIWPNENKISNKSLRQAWNREKNKNKKESHFFC